MDGGDDEPNYNSHLQIVAEGEWAGWCWFPGADPFEDMTGPFYFREDDQGVVCAFGVEPRHTNGGGFMHGGCMMAFADFALFVIARDPLKDHHAVTATFNGELVGQVRPGQIVEARGEVVKAGRSMVFVRGMLTSDGAPVMSFSSALKKTGARRPHS